MSVAPRHIEFTTDEHKVAYVRACWGWSTPFEPLPRLGFETIGDVEYQNYNFAVVAVPRHLAAEVTLDGLRDYRGRFQTSCGHYLCPFLPHRWDEMFALGFIVREGDVAVVIDLRVLRNLRIRLWRVAGYPNTP